MREALQVHGAQLDEAPVKTPGAIGIVESYHAPLRIAYERVTTKVQERTTDQECLDLEVFGINCTVGPEGPCPALLTFGALTRPSRTTPKRTQVERVR